MILSHPIGRILDLLDLPDMQPARMKRPDCGNFRSDCAASDLFLRTRNKWVSRNNGILSFTATQNIQLEEGQRFLLPISNWQWAMIINGPRNKKFVVIVTNLSLMSAFLGTLVEFLVTLTKTE